MLEFDGRARVTMKSEDCLRVTMKSEDGLRVATRSVMMRVILDYEVRSSWWTPFMFTRSLQTAASYYFAWKVKRKFRKWEQLALEGDALRAQKTNLTVAGPGH